MSCLVFCTISRKSFFVLLITFNFLLLSFSGIAQKTDTTLKTEPIADTLKIKKHSPRKATLMSTIIPGAGQIYNRKYWKVPIIYAGAAAVVYLVDFNKKYYRDFRQAYKDRLNNKTDKYPNYKDQDLIDLKNYYRRNLELSYIAGGLLYIINILDAAVDANLYDYNINDDLSFKVEPVCYPSYDNNINFAMKFTLKIK
jgi:hypothetical protein